MNAAHFHLIVNHLPLFAAMFGGLLMAAGLWRRSENLTRAGLMLGLVAGLGAGLASFSGERAEELVEGDVLDQQFVRGQGNGGVIEAKPRRGVGLRIEVDDQNPPPHRSQSGG